MSNPVAVKTTVLELSQSNFASFYSRLCTLDTKKARIGKHSFRKSECLAWARRMEELALGNFESIMVTTPNTDPYQDDAGVKRNGANLAMATKINSMFQDTLRRALSGDPAMLTELSQTSIGQSVMKHWFCSGDATNLISKFVGVPIDPLAVTRTRDQYCNLIP